MTKAELEKIRKQLKTLKPAERMPGWVVDAIFNHIEEQEVQINRLKWDIEQCKTCQTRAENKSGAV